MSNKKPTAADGVLIGREYWDVPVRIKLRAYLHFGRRIDGQLRRLVVRWSHTASPKARGVQKEPDQPNQIRPAVARPPPLAEENSPLDRWNCRSNARPHPP
jgi:hypothetical protein